MATTATIFETECGWSVVCRPCGDSTCSEPRTGGLQVEVGSERAVASLAAPLQNAYVDPWNLNCQLTGDLNGWLRHLQNFVDVGNIQVAGQADMTFAAILDSNLLRLDNINYEFQQFAFDGYGTKIREPKVTVKEPRPTTWQLAN